MDDLLALDSAFLIRDGTAVKHEEGSEASADVSGQNLAGTKRLSSEAVAASLSAKKRRRQTSTSASTLTSPVKAEPSDGSGSVKQEPGVEEVAETETDDKCCLGCSRSALDGRDFFDPTMRTPWALPNRRGSWCRDCHTTWRTCWLNDHGTLLFFQQWLKQPPNHAEFELSLTSYLSLCYEDHPRITGVMITQRMRLIKWLSSFMCTAWQPSVVVPLEDLPPDSPGSSQPTRLTSTQLLTISSSDGPRVGALVPQAWAALPATYAIARPHRDGPFTPVPSRQLLFTSSENDRAILENHFGEDVVVVQAKGLEAGPPTSGALADAAAGKSRHECKFLVLKSQATTLLMEFGKETWESVKESSFTSHVKHLQSFAQEAAQIGEKESVLAESSLWSDGVFAGKLFCKGYRDYARSKHKHNKFMELSKPLKDFRRFMHEVGMSLAPALDLQWHKMCFYTAAAENGTCHDGLKAILDQGVGELWQTMSQDTKSPSIGVWLRSVCFHCLATLLVQADATSLEASVTPLERDVLRTITLLESTPASVGAALHECRHDLEQFHRLLLASVQPGAVLAGVIHGAMKHLDERRMAPLKSALHESALGKMVISAVAHVLQVSAQDAAGDDKFKLAQKILYDPRLPRLVVGTTENQTSKATVANFQMLSEMSIVGVLDDGLTNLQEAVSLWSRAQQSIRSSEYGAVVRDLAKNLQLFDECLCAFLQAQVFADGFGEVLISQDRSGEEEHELTVECARKLSARLSKHLVDEAPMAAFLDRMKAFLQELPCDIKQDVPSEEIIVLLTGLGSNITTREEMVDLLESLSLFLPLPSDARAVVMEWTTKRNAGAEESSFLTRAVNARKSALLLEDKAFVLDDEDYELKICLDEDGRGAIEGSFGHARHLPKQVANLSLLEKLRALLQESVQCLVDGFADASAMACVRMPESQTAVTDIMPAQAAVDLVFHKVDGVQENIKEAAKVFATTTRREQDWQCAAVKAMILFVAESIPSSDISVNMRAFCAPSSGAAAATETTSGTTAMASAAPTLTCVNDLRTVLEICDVVSRVAVSLGYLRLRFMDTEDAEPSTKDHKLKPEVESAINSTRTTLNHALQSMRAGAHAQLGRFNGAPWVVPLHRAAHWLEITSKVVTRVCRHFLKRSVDDALLLARSTQKVTPTYDHIASASHFNLKLAKKSLLGWPSRPALNKNTISLFHAIANASRLHTSWALQPKLTEDPILGDAMEECSGLLSNARRAVAVIAAAQVLLELKGEEQQQQASGLLAKRKEELPASLVQALEKVVA